MSGPMVLAVITARSGSKGVPGKNVRPVAGRPLIAWTIEPALRASRIDRTIVSTESEAIASVARSVGAEVPFRRPEELSQDDTPHLPVLLHAVEWMAKREAYKPDYVLLLQPTSPLRGSADIDAAVDLAIREKADAVVAVTETHHHPYLIVTLGPDGRIARFLPDAPKPGTGSVRRQELPTAYFINGAIYLVRTDVLLRERTLFPPATYPYVMPAERSLQIDDEWELRLADLVLAEQTRTAERGDDHAVLQ
jgi:CMP-N,N'-diacetyllegionaminic acid synthase